MKFPRLLMVRQNLPNRALADVAAETRAQMESLNPASKLKPGDTVAIGAGSRGIRNIDIILREVVRYWKERGVSPFIFPAMGSHGAATAEGQADVLAHYGVTESAMGCPVVSQLEVVSLGRTADGVEAFMDWKAYEASGLMVVNRVKWHTDFSGEIESGLFKMLALGLGKLAGAQRYHSLAVTLGLEHIIVTVGRKVLDSGKVLGGVAILEDAYHNTAAIRAVAAADMERCERENLALVKSWMARIPTDLDVLILDEMGKDISGTGMDTKVVNRTVNAQEADWPGPRNRRIFVRELTPLSYGNAIGMGLADMATDRMVDRVDWEATKVNVFTSTNLPSCRTPLHCATDLECLEALTPTVGKLDPFEVTYGWLRNTLEVTRLALSANLRPQIERNAKLVIENEFEFQFDDGRNLVSPFGRLRDTASAR